ncbi:MAG: dGTPase [Shewanella xiamenensis]
MKNISVQRHRQSTAEHSELLDATQSDRARLIYSAAFRRLQQKAQVFSLEGNSAVRSRLTHSIEVSHIGRYLVSKVIEKISLASNISEDDRKFWKENGLAISNIVEAACLMHDIGNPPFGHFGEAAISHWAKSEQAKLCIKSSTGVDLGMNEDVLKDFIYFDGNPQGFRIITKLQGSDGFYGLNLTYTQLASFLKYTYCSSKINASLNSPFSKKIGFFDTEIDVATAMWKSLDMPENTRHPLGFLMEASDDISYCISDIEDGIEKGIINFEHFVENVGKDIEIVSENFKHPDICQKLLLSLRNNNGVIGSFIAFKTSISNYLVNKVSSTFVESYNAIVSFDKQEELISKGSLEYALLEVLKKYTGVNLFSSHEAECMELSGYSIISGILSVYQKLLVIPKDKFLHLVLNNSSEIKANNLHIERRLFNRLPIKHLNAYKAAVCNESVLQLNDEILKDKFTTLDVLIEWNLRAHLIVDFISGMTDQFSLEFYQMLEGINVKF